MITRVLLIAMLASACSRSPKAPPAPPLATVAVDRWTFEDVAEAAQRLDTEFAARGEVLTRDRFLPHIKSVYRSRYTILHDSDANEGVNPHDAKDGRVLAFGEDASLVLAWTRDGNEVQVAQHRESRLEMRRIAFARSKGEKLEISGPNPEECGGSACHGDPKDPHYRWDQYPNWPKAYAGIEDYVQPGAEETRLKGLFADGHPAFASLVTPRQFAKSFATFRIGMPRKVRGPDATLERESGASYQYRPNTFLTLALGANHAEQMFHHLKADRALYETMRAPLLFVMTRCRFSNDAVNQRINLRLAALHQAAHRPGPPPQIDDGQSERRWMPWFTFLGTDPARWQLADREAPARSGYHTDHLYNVGFTSLAYLVAAFLWEDLIEDQPGFAEHYLRGTLRDIEEKYLNYVDYSDRAAHARQTQILDQMSRFLNVKPRPSLSAIRTDDDKGRWRNACEALAEETRQHLDP